MFEAMIKNQTAKQAKELAAWMARREETVALPEGVWRTEDVAYLDDGLPCHRMDLYQPIHAGPARPVLLNLHGGGFLLGSKEVNRYLCTDLSRRGFLVMSLEYPLAPEATIFDIFRALTTGIDRAAALAADYGGDPAQLYLCGDSAGAYLCYYLAALQNAPEAAQAAGVPQIKTKIQAIGLQSGMFYTRKLDQVGLFLPKLLYGSGWRAHPFRPYLDPGHPALVAAVPPCFLVTGRGDFLRNYSRQLASALKRGGKNYKLLDLDEAKPLPHAFAALLPETPAATRANEQMLAFFLQQAPDDAPHGADSATCGDGSGKILKIPR